MVKMAFAGIGVEYESSRRVLIESVSIASRESLTAILHPLPNPARHHRDLFISQYILDCDQQLEVGELER